ncbi:MAG: AMIN domain-containing protein [Pseudomonadota bacterium]
MKNSILILVAGLILLHPASGTGQEWGKIMSVQEKTNIRAARSIHAKISGLLNAGDRVRADFLKDGWYAVFAPDEQKRVKSRARGYVHASRLEAVPVPVASKKTDRKTESVSQETQTATVSQKEPPLEVKNIAVKFEPAGHEKVIIDFNLDAVPELFSIEGKDPRIVIDIKNVSSVRHGLSRINVRGRLIRQIRSNLDHVSHHLRIVVDLSPSINYEVEPAFYRAEKVYVLDISEAPLAQEK